MKTVVVGTAGHIDHGKSTLVRALTGIDPDRLKEEQARGITIDLGFAHMVVGDAQIAFVDVPGHERFVRNMLAGAGGIDAVLLVVDAQESVMPQTREHFEICRLLGIDRGLVVVTKVDRANDAGVSAAIASVRDLVAESFLADAPVVPVSAQTGAGLDALRTELAALAGRAPRLQRDGLVRLPIDRAFGIRGHGAVVTGTLVSGAISVGDMLDLLPDGDPVRLRGVQAHGRAATTMSAPGRVAVNLAGVDLADLGRGMTLATPGSLPVTRATDVRVSLLRGARPLLHSARVRVHHGSWANIARLSIAATRFGRAGGWVRAEPGDASAAVPAGEDAYARLRFEEPVVLTRGDRLVLRTLSPAATVGGAVVLDPEPASGGVRRESALPRFAALDASDARAAAVFLADAAARGLDAQSLVRRAGLSPAAASRTLEEMISAGSAVALAGRVFARDTADLISTRILDELTRFHAARPGDEGMPRETLRARVVRRDESALFEAMLADLATRGAVRGADRIALATYKRPVSSAADELQQRVAARLRDAALAPPELAALAIELREARPAIDRAVQALSRARLIIKLGDLVFDANALATLKNEVQELRRATPGVRVTLDVGMFKTRYGLTRKHAIPLLEWLDRERVTRRIGAERIVI